jgi:hypothetical protein
MRPNGVEMKEDSIPASSHLNHVEASGEFWAS